MLKIEEGSKIKTQSTRIKAAVSQPHPDASTLLDIKPEVKVSNE